MKNSFYINGDEVHITLNSETYGDKILICDKADLEKVKTFHWKWSLIKKKNTYYASSKTNINGVRKNQQFHRFIMGEDREDFVVDHIDGDGLNCKRSNLRITTKQENSQNRRGVASHSLTGKRGVTLNKNTNKYESYIILDKKRIYLGLYASLEEAGEISSIARAISMPMSNKDVVEKNFYLETSNPSLYFRFGEMSGGKSEGLINTAYVHEKLGRKVVALKPVIDTRSNSNTIQSRSGKSIEAIDFNKEDDLFELVSNSIMRYCDSIFVDEVNFITKEQVEQLAKIVSILGISVFGYGLRTDAFTNLFEGSMRMFELADVIQVISRNCQIDGCENKSVFNMRLIDGIPTFKGKQIQVGGDESYQSVCSKHYYKLKEMNN